MARIVLTYAVEDVPAWKSRSRERIAFFTPFATDVIDHVPTDGSNVVAVTMNVNDMLGFNATVLATPSCELRDVHAVTGPLSVWIEEHDSD